jgi:hypothetical protein
MRWWLPIGDKLRQGQRQGQAAKRPDLPSGECNVCKDNATKAETQEIKDGPATGLCDIDDIGGHTKPVQYGRSMCRLGHGSARASSRQAFLTADGEQCACAADTTNVLVILWPPASRATLHCRNSGSEEPPSRRADLRSSLSPCCRFIHRQQKPNATAILVIKACHQNNRGRAALIERRSGRKSDHSAQTSTNELITDGRHKTRVKVV